MSGEIFALARQLARPVARGLLPGSHAYAALALVDPKAAPIAFHILRRHANAEVWRIRLTEYRIECEAWYGIDRHKPLNAILAECHGYNGAAEFPLTEETVTDLVAAVIERARRRARHA